MAPIVELIGYIASVLVALSLTMANVWRLRWINLGGAVAFVLYAGAIAAWPVLLVNAWIAGVNVFYLRRMANARDSFEAFSRPADDPILLRFIEKYRDDIERYFPSAALKAGESRCWMLVMRNLAPVGLVAYEWEESGSAHIHVDYVTPAYRDFKNGQKLYEPHHGMFAEQGATVVRTRAHVDEYRRYLYRMGFRPTESDPALFEKRLIEPGV